MTFISIGGAALAWRGQVRPSALNEHNLFEQNRFQLNDAALVFHGITRCHQLARNDGCDAS